MAKHAWTYDHRIKWDEANILAIDSHRLSRKMRESIEIEKHNTIHSKNKRAVLAPWGRLGFSKCEPFWPSMGPKQKTGAILATCRAILATF